MSRPAKDQTGKIYGKWTVLERAKQRTSYGDIAWVCRCECGTIRNVGGKILRKGRSRSCGECNKTIIKTGDVFGKLTVIQKSTKKDANNHSYWKCQCDCGKILQVRGTNLAFGNSLSCGCLKASHGEIIIANILKENNILFEQEYKIPALPRQRFDFAIFEDNSLIRLIEFDGQQHFKEINFGRYSLKERQELDQKKNKWARENNIPLARIPYWEIKNITLEMLFSERFVIN